MNQYKIVIKQEFPTMARLDAALADHARGYVLVDLKAIQHNLMAMHEGLPRKTKMLAVIKADAYGHGSLPIARAIESAFCLYGFAVATIEEALLLREAGIEKPIVILGHTFPTAYKQLVQYDIYPTVFRPDCLAALEAAAAACGKVLQVHIKVDTGMSRIGIAPDETGLAFVDALAACPHLHAEGIFTHFARADEADKTCADAQYAQFVAFTEQVEARLGYPILLHHCANSATLLDMPDKSLDLVRAGISLYGLAPSMEVDPFKKGIRPALSWHSHIAHIKELPAGRQISYGGTFTTPSPMRVATIPIGYGDGYPRSLSNKGYVLIAGKKAPILGRVCMDQMMVDVTQIPEATLDSFVTLLGSDSFLQTEESAAISCETLGDLSGRFNYELVCDINKRMPRIYLL